MEGPEASQERMEQPATRWRALLDRARGARSDEPVPDPGDDLSWLDDADDAGTADPWSPRPGATYVSVAARQARQPDWEPAPPDAPPARDSRPPARDSRPLARESPAPAGESPSLDREAPSLAREAPSLARESRPTVHNAHPPAHDVRLSEHDVPPPACDRYPTAPPSRAAAERVRELPLGHGHGDARPSAPPDVRPSPHRGGRAGGAPQPAAQGRGGRTRVAERPPGRPRPAEPVSRQPWDEGPVTWRPRLGDGQRGRAVEALAGRPRTAALDVDLGGAGGGAGSGAFLADRGGHLSFRRVAVAEDDPAVRLRGRFGGPRVIAFANPKGGVHKTTATVLAAATIGAARGRGVVAWDDNELRGTLGLRAGTARHARTVRHLVAELERIEQAPDAVVRERLDEYLRHAPDASYDILAGEEDPRFARQLDAVTVQRVLDLLRRTHEVVCVDTGNNVQSANWQTVLRGCDQLVVTTVPREDAAFAADWMLDLLHEIGLGALADNAVTLVSSTTPTRSALARDIERHFAGRTRAVVAVPYDPALETGSAIDHHALRAGTRRDWLRAAATVMAPFVS